MSESGIKLFIRKILLFWPPDKEETLNKAKSTEIYKQYEENTENAYKSGVFGSPTFIYKGEVFWGDDRLEDCIKWINIK